MMGGKIPRLGKALLWEEASEYRHLAPEYPVEVVASAPAPHEVVELLRRLLACRFRERENGMT